MKKKILYKILFISVSFLFLLFGFFGNRQLKHNLQEPFKWKNWGNEVVITDILSNRLKQQDGVVKGDVLIKVEDKIIHKGQELEFLFDTEKFDLNQPFSYTIRRGVNKLVIIGIFPFLFLWTLPEVIGFSPLIPMEFNYIFLFVIPLAFSFSIIKYQVMDINFVINRSIVYTILTGIIVGMYLLLVGVTGQFLHGLSQASNLMIIIFTLVAAIIFSPIKQQVQVLVDKTFYRIKYDYRMAIKNFGKSLSTANSQEELIRLFFEKLNKAIPAKKIAFLLHDSSTNYYTVRKSYGISEKKVETEFQFFCQTNTNY